MIKNHPHYPSPTDALLLASFFISGCSALIYQVSWQRALYGLIGVDMDSITIIVSVFMLGIGLGGMLGGWLSDRFPRQRLRWYAGIELSIALYGGASLWLLQVLQAGLAGSFLGDGAVGSAVASFGFLLLPTVLMGMTLPLLTMAFDERTANIGVSVGTLYFINTLGAATGAALVPFCAAAAVDVAASGLGGRGGQCSRGAVCRAGGPMAVAHCCGYYQNRSARMNYPALLSLPAVLPA